MKFIGNFGTLDLIINEDGLSIGKYQNGGILEGIYKKGYFEGQWSNKGQKGLIKFVISNGKLNGTWKKGLKPGPMKGKWEGLQAEEDSYSDEKKNSGILPEIMYQSKLILKNYESINLEIFNEKLEIDTKTSKKILLKLQEDNLISKENEDGLFKNLTYNSMTHKVWNIINDIGVFYVFFGNLAENAAQKQEWDKIVEFYSNWVFDINDCRFGLKYNNPSNLEQSLNLIYDELYIENGKPTKDPLIQLNNSYTNLINYYNNNHINCQNIKTILSTVFEICTQRKMTDDQKERLKWFIEDFGKTCNNLESITDLIELYEMKEEMKSDLNNTGVEVKKLDD